MAEMLIHTKLYIILDQDWYVSGKLSNHQERAVRPNDRIERST
jgi:hypothetical protein